MLKTIYKNTKKIKYYILKSFKLFILLYIFYLFSACYEKKISKKLINPHCSLIFSKSSKQGITLDYYSVSSHGKVVLVNDSLLVEDFVGQLSLNRFSDISNTLDIIESFYIQDSTLLDSYIIGSYEAFLLKKNLKDSLYKIEVCNIYVDAYLDNIAKLERIFSKKQINTNMIFYENRSYSGLIRTYESKDLLIIVFVRELDINFFVGENTNYVELNAYGFYKDSDSTITKDISKFGVCKEIDLLN